MAEFPVDGAALDSLGTEEILRLMNEEDRRVAPAVEREIPRIARAVEIIAAALGRGGRLFYVGAGTSGRLGVVDAAECPPTFGVSPEMVQAVIAGGLQAVAGAVEAAEDDEEAGRREIAGRDVSSRDVVVGISASGSTPYTVAAVREARDRGAATIALCCVPGSPLARVAGLAICPVVGPEVLAGSTRLKAGTAQKMVLNMLSTAAMIRLGKVYRNFMIDLRPTNRKLWERACHIVSRVAGVSPEVAERGLREAGGEARVAVVMLLGGMDAAEARMRLSQGGNSVRGALEGRAARSGMKP